jgi:hypothetical protein
METLKTIFLILFLIMALFASFLLTITLQKHKNFKRFLKEGDKVDFYVGEIRNTYTLEKYGEIFCEIRNENGTIRKVETSELLPNFWQSYKYKS